MKNCFPKLTSRAILGPMAGVTDIAFRGLAKRYGTGLTYTEFVSCAGLVRNNLNTLKMIRVGTNEKPIGVQLFGNSIEEIVNAAKLVENKFDVIDVNCGCPAWKVIKTGAGSAILNDINKIGKLINKLASSVNKPVTLKIRTGIDEKRITAVQVAKIAEENGAAAITVHGRTQKQGFNGKANWSIISKVKRAVNIPVIGNGDIFSPEDFKKRLQESNVDYIMIGRGAIGNPFIFKQINDFLSSGKYELKNSLEQFTEYLQIAIKYKLRFNIIKNQAIYFTKGLKNSSRLRERLNKCKKTNEIKKEIKSF